MEEQLLYPIGIQTFSNIREEHYVYVDKTELVYRLTHSASKYIFLSRPLRFGKSLLASTLCSYFEGRKDLFEGLAMERLEKEWTSYPVLHFDMSMAKHMDRDRLLSELERKLAGYEKLYLLFTLIGNYVDVEVRTPKGRVDMVLRTPHMLYVIELKIGASADTAMEQIDLKDYPERFALCGLPIVKVGINFDTEKRTIEGWKIEPTVKP